MAVNVVAKDDWTDFMTVASQISCEVCFLSAFIAFLRQREMDVHDGIKRLRIHIESMGSNSLDCLVGLATSLTLLSLGPCDMDNRATLQPELAVVLQILTAYHSYIPMSSLPKVREVCTAILTARNRIQAISASLAMALAPNSNFDLIKNSEKGKNGGKYLGKVHYIYPDKRPMESNIFSSPPCPSQLSLKSMKLLKQHLQSPLPTWNSDLEFLDRKVRLIEWKAQRGIQSKNAKNSHVEGHESHRNFNFSSLNSEATKRGMSVADERKQLRQQLEVAENLLRNLLFCLVELKSRHRHQSQVQALPLQVTHAAPTPAEYVKDRRKSQPHEGPSLLSPSNLERAVNAQTFPTRTTNIMIDNEKHPPSPLRATISSIRVSLRVHPEERSREIHTSEADSDATFVGTLRLSSEYSASYRLLPCRRNRNAFLRADCRDYLKSRGH